MKKIMMLGAGGGQIPFIETCKKLKAYVIVISPMGDYAGIKLADKFYDCDVKDKEKVLEIAKKEKITAIVTDQTDISVTTVAWVAEQLGLKGIGYDRAIKFTDKYEMRLEAERIGVPVPKFAKARDISEAKKCVKRMELPVIIKPTNCYGSKGVYRINDVEELEKYFELSQRYSHTDTVIIEEFIEGIEFLADGFAMNNKYINLDVGIKEHFHKQDIYVSKMCMFSSPELIEESTVEKRILDTNKRLVEGMGLPFGITHAEYIYSPKEDKVFLVEIAARGGGVYLSSHLTPRASGINTNELLIDYLLNDTIIDVDDFRLSRRVSAWRCFELQEGTIVSIENIDALHKIPGVDDVYLDNLCVGKQVGGLQDDSTKHGPILISGNSREDCYETLKQIENTLKIVTVNDGVLSGIRW